MKKLITIFIITLSFVTSVCEINAQYCGQGYNGIVIYVRNGLNAVNPQYRLYPASPLRYKEPAQSMQKLGKVAEYLSTTFFPYEEVYFSRWWIRPKIVRNDHAESFINAYDPKMFEQPFIDEVRDRKFIIAAKIIRDSFTIPTYEMDDMPYLLKVWADNYEPVYVLEAFRGGCSRNYNLLLTDYRLPSAK
ncbi:MAG TPA: hypothetical protein PKA82_15385 [Pyrinomonadaceae bacterium]|mgnify:CR=1 FL=1|nr:hypothetical protein [Pyrinomonadaceae bacterium]